MLGKCSPIALVQELLLISTLIPSISSQQSWLFLACVSNFWIWLEYAPLKGSPMWCLCQYFQGDYSLLQQIVDMLYSNSSNFVDKPLKQLDYKFFNNESNLENQRHWLPQQWWNKEWTQSSIDKVATIAFLKD